MPLHEERKEPKPSYVGILRPAQGQSVYFFMFVGHTRGQEGTTDLKRMGTVLTWERTASYEGIFGEEKLTFEESSTREPQRTGQYTARRSAREPPTYEGTYTSTTGEHGTFTLESCEGRPVDEELVRMMLRARRTV